MLFVMLFHSYPFERKSDPAGPRGLALVSKHIAGFVILRAAIAERSSSKGGHRLPKWIEKRIAQQQIKAAPKAAIVCQSGQEKNSSEAEQSSSKGVYRLPKWTGKRTAEKQNEAAPKAAIVYRSGQGQERLSSIACTSL